MISFTKMSYETNMGTNTLNEFLRKEKVAEIVDVKQTMYLGEVVLTIFYKEEPFVPAGTAVHRDNRGRGVVPSFQ